MSKKEQVEPEYTLNVFRNYDEQTRKTRIAFLVQTLKIFVSFRYQILLEDKVAGNQIDLGIIGLYAPTMLMPGTGPAQGLKEYENLRGTYTLRVAKQDKSVNVFELEFTTKSIVVKKSPPNPFIVVSTEPVLLP